MAMAARVTAFLVLISGTSMVNGEQGRIVWTTAPPAVSGGPVVTYAPSVQGTLALPPPPPLTMVPVQVGPVVTYNRWCRWSRCPRSTTWDKACWDNPSCTCPTSRCGTSCGT
jgi:hypothetical protein